MLPKSIWKIPSLIYWKRGVILNSKGYASSIFENNLREIEFCFLFSLFFLISSSSATSCSCSSPCSIYLFIYLLCKREREKETQRERDYIFLWFPSPSPSPSSISSPSPNLTRIRYAFANLPPGSSKKLSIHCGSFLRDQWTRGYIGLHFNLYHSDGSKKRIENLGSKLHCEDNALLLLFPLLVQMSFSILMWFSILFCAPQEIFESS